MRQRSCQAILHVQNVRDCYKYNFFNHLAFFSVPLCAKTHTDTSENIWAPVIYSANN